MRLMAVPVYSAYEIDGLLRARSRLDRRRRVESGYRRLRTVRTSKGDRRPNRLTDWTGYAEERPDFAAMLRAVARDWLRFRDVP